MIDTKIYSLLSGATVLTVDLGTRMYPVKIPQEATYPHLVFTQISGGQVNGLDGYLTLENPRIQVDIYSTSANQAKTIGSNVHTVMNGSTDFKNTLQSSGDIYEEEVNKYRVTQDYSCWNRE